MKRLLLLGSLALCAACGGDSKDGGSCRERAACGGDIVGSWAVQSVCFTDNTLADSFTDSLPEECSNAVEQTTTSPKDLVVEYTAGGTSSTSGNINFAVRARLSQACLNAVAGTTFPISNTSCGFVAESARAQTEEDFPDSTYSCQQSGDSCLCDFSTLAPLTGSGTYTLRGNQIVQDGDADEYCVSGNTLTFQAPEGQFEARRLR